MRRLFWCKSSLVKGNGACEVQTTGTLVWKKPDGMTVCFEIMDEPLVVGRGDDADVRIMDLSISRRHFAVTPRDNAFFVEDLSSTNGTWVNDRRLGEPHELRVFDRIRAGNELFVFDREITTPKKSEAPK